MQLNESARMIYGLVDEFGQKEVMDIGYAELEPKGEFPHKLMEETYKLGTMGLTFPEEYGGSGMDTVAASVVAERKAFYLPSWHLIWTASHGLAGYPIMTFGNEYQKKRFLPCLASGEILGCYALSEPNAGSDAAAIETRATWDKKRKVWVLKGTKTWITNADEARVGVVFARVGSGKSKKRHEEITAFILESKKPGLEIQGVEINVIPKWGLRCSHFAEIVLDDVLVSDANVLGEVGKGFHIAMETLNNGRINIAAQSVGIARRALFEAVSYGSERMAFGKPIIKIRKQADRLKRLTKRADRAWELVLRVSDAKDLGCDYRVEAAEAKLFSSETAVVCAMFNYRLHGGLGYTTEAIAMSILHDALATVTYEGTSDILKMVIAKNKKIS